MSGKPEVEHCHVQHIDKLQMSLQKREERKEVTVTKLRNCFVVVVVVLLLFVETVSLSIYLLRGPHLFHQLRCLCVCFTFRHSWWCCSKRRSRCRRTHAENSTCGVERNEELHRRFRKRPRKKTVHNRVPTNNVRREQRLSTKNRPLYNMCVTVFCYE